MKVFTRSSIFVLVQTRFLARASSDYSRPNVLSSKRNGQVNRSYCETYPNSFAMLQLSFEKFLRVVDMCSMPGEPMSWAASLGIAFSTSGFLSFGLQFIPSRTIGTHAVIRVAIRQNGGNLTGSDGEGPDTGRFNELIASRRIFYVPRLSRPLRSRF